MPDEEIKHKQEYDIEENKISCAFSEASTVKIDSSSPYLFKIDKILSIFMSKHFKFDEEYDEMINQNLSELESPYRESLTYLIDHARKQEVLIISS